MTHITENPSKRKDALSVTQRGIKHLRVGLCTRAMEKKWITKVLTEEVPWRTCQLVLLAVSKIDLGSLSGVSFFH